MVEAGIHPAWCPIFIRCGCLARGGRPSDMCLRVCVIRYMDIAIPEFDLLLLHALATRIMRRINWHR